MGHIVKDEEEIILEKCNVEVVGSPQSVSGVQEERI